MMRTEDMIEVIDNFVEKQAKLVEKWLSDLIHEPSQVALNSKPRLTSSFYDWRVSGRTPLVRSLSSRSFDIPCKPLDGVKRD